MKLDEVRASVVQLLKESRNRPLTAAELGGGLGLRGAEKKRLQKWLHEMVLRGDIVRVRENRYSLGAPADLLTGRLQVFRSGDGLVTAAEGGGAMFVPRLRMGTALAGDTVVVRRIVDEPRRDGDDRPVGKVIEIVERGRRDLVGTLRSAGRFFYVVPLDPVYKQDFYVADTKGARPNDRVMVRFTSWANEHVNPEGEIVEVLGPADSPTVDTLSVIRHYRLGTEFPSSTMREAETASRLMARPGRRLDLRSRLILTIDPETARDFDDALSLEDGPDGRMELGVHIADVSHFVQSGSALDRTARERGNSVYLPDKVLPMLPEQLSNGVCSLNPGEDRLTFSAFLTLSPGGVVESARFAKSVIRSRYRLTYEQALAVLNGEDRVTVGVRDRQELGADGVALLRRLNAVAQELRRRRFARYALDLDMPECEVKVGADGVISEIRTVGTDPSHQLVEECMVAANEAVAAELSRLGLPYPARVHEPPREEKIEEVSAELLGMGYQPGDLKNRKHLAAFLKAVAGDPLANHVRVAVLKSMNRAVYSPKADGHFGLAKRFYAHFTSPIRRYPDLVVHRQLAAALDAGGKAESGRGAARLYGESDIAALAVHCSQTEQTAEEAERALLEIMKCRYLARQLTLKEPATFEAGVVNVTNFGLFVELALLQVQGLIHISALSDSFVRHDRARRTLRAGSRLYKVGDRLRVQVAKVDMDSRRVDFVPVLSSCPRRDGSGIVPSPRA